MVRTSAMRRSRSSASNFSRFAWFRCANCFSTAWWSTACPAGQEVTVHSFIIGMKMRRLCSGVAGAVSCSCKRRGADAVLPVLLHSGFHPVLSLLTQLSLTPAMLPFLLPHFASTTAELQTSTGPFSSAMACLALSSILRRFISSLFSSSSLLRTFWCTKSSSLVSLPACKVGTQSERAREDRMGSETACTPYHKVFNSGVLQLGSEMRVLLQDPLHLHQVMLVMQL